MNDNNNESCVKNKIPAITSHTNEIKKIKQFIDQLNISYSLVLVNNNKVRILPKSKEAHAKIKDKLSASNVEYYTYTCYDDKPKNYIIKGLHKTFEPEEVKEAILALYPDITENIIKINHLNTNRSQKNINNINLFLIQFNSATDMKPILQCNSLLHLRGTSSEARIYTMLQLPVVVV